MAKTPKKRTRKTTPGPNNREANQLARLFSAQCPMYGVELPMELVFVLVGMFERVMDAREAR